MARQFLPSGSAVKHLRDTGFLQVPGTTCGHCVWLDDEEIAIMAECDATAVHNPFSNLRLGSGVAPLNKYARGGMNVCLGADGACSSDGQDMLEVAKLANILPCIATPEYRDWPTAHYTALVLGAANGYKGMLLEGKPGQIGKGGVLEEGALAEGSHISYPDGVHAWASEQFRRLKRRQAELLGVDKDGRQGSFLMRLLVSRL